MISLILVMVSAIAAGWLANRITVPYPIVLVLVGIGLGIAYTWPALDLDPDLVLAIVLPSILYPAAIDTSWRDFRRMLRPILLLAIGLVVMTTLAVGLALKGLVPGVPWAVAFALGAIVSPPDAVAATAVLRRFKLPRRVVTLLEGESLVNDATGLVLYRFAVGAALTGVFHGSALVGQFALIAVGGLVIGIGVGWVSTRVQARLGDPMLELSMSLTAPFIAYWLCESLEVSGVLGVVAAGLYRSGWSHRHSSPLTRLNIRTVWGAIVFVINSLVFVLIGIRMPQIAELAKADGLSWQSAVGLIAALSAVAIGVRFLWIFTATYGVRLLVPEIQRRDPASARISTLVSWSGMRGVVSLAAAVALPSMLASGEPFPYRGLVLLLAYGIVFVTLVGQGLTLPALIRTLRIKADTSQSDETRLARDAMRRAATDAVDKLVAEQGLPAHEAVAIKRFFSSRSFQGASGPASPDSEARMWLGASAAQRKALIDLWKKGEIGDDVLIRLERELDLAEARLPRED